MADAEGVRAFRPCAVWGPVVTGKTDNLKLTDEQKTRLLGFALEPDQSAPVDKDEEKGDLLCDILRCPLAPIEPAARSLEKTFLPLRPVFGPPLGQLLADPETDITVLRQIKEYAKALGKSAGSEVEKEVFLAVYFAAIAAALASCGERITEHSDQDLGRFFRSFADAKWVPNDLVKVFDRGTLPPKIP